MPPKSVTRQNASQLFDYLEQKRRNQAQRKTKTKFHIGDLVRIPLNDLGKKKFKKGATPNWSNQLYKIVKIHYGTLVPTFTLHDARGKPQLRRYYENELNFVMSSFDL